MPHSLATLIGGNAIGMAFRAGMERGYIVVVEELHHNLLRIFAETLVYFVVFDAYFYAGHRLFHTKYLWLIHRPHHRSKTPNALAGTSFHPIEGVLFGMFLPCYATILTHCLGGIPKGTLVVCGALQFLQSIAIHSGLDATPAWWFEHPILSKLLTPTFHDRHHECPNCNYAGFFTWLDDFFGTADQHWRSKYASWKRHGRNYRTVSTRKKE